MSSQYISQTGIYRVHRNDEVIPTERVMKIPRIQRIKMKRPRRPRKVKKIRKIGRR